MRGIGIRKPGGTFTNREDPDAKLKSHTIEHFIRVYTVCYGKKRAPGTKIQYFEKSLPDIPFLYTMDYPKLIIVSNQKVKYH